MKVIMVMFDSLNRRMLEPYNCDWVKTPNFTRLAKCTVTFENSYAGSMPCMPARRELQTGRQNFLHRGWGPLEPFDDSIPEILKNKGIYTHIVTDHGHYFEDGGCTYHSKYNSWEHVRGQEGDKWKGHVEDPVLPKNYDPKVSHRDEKMLRQDIINRSYMDTEEKMSMPQTFSLGLEFLEKNADQDNWFLQIETFDPHEPYFSSNEFKKLYDNGYDGPFFDWPPYEKVTQEKEVVNHCRLESAALHSMCDKYLGKVLDAMDRLNLWDDTLLIVNTDHGFLLSEHDFWAKGYMPFYDEVIHTPLFIWDPRSRKTNERRESLVTTIDIGTTILECFGIPLTQSMEGIPLKETIANDTQVHDAVLFGIFGAQVNVTDGHYVYMRGRNVNNQTQIYEYTLMPCDMTHTKTPKQLKDVTLSEPLSFTKGCPVLKIPAPPMFDDTGINETVLYDLYNDPKQDHPIMDAAIEQRMINLMVELMKKNNAPIEQFERLGLPY